MRAAWCIAAGATLVLLAMSAAYALTYEPAPMIGIRWRDGLAPERRAELERRHLLVNPTPVGDRFAYDLLDIRQSNLRALVEERDAFDTDGISRQDATLPPDYRYGESWMWVAHRTPVLRERGIVDGIRLTCVALLLGSAGIIIRSRRRLRARTRE